MKRLLWLFLLLLVLGSVYWIFQREIHHQYDLQIVGEMPLPGGVTARMGNYLLTAQNKTLHILEVIPPNTFRELSTIRLEIEIEIEAITVTGTKVYLFDLVEDSAANYGEINVLDLVNPQQPYIKRVDSIKSTPLDKIAHHASDYKLERWSKDVKVGQSGVHLLETNFVVESNFVYLAYAGGYRHRAFSPDLRGVAIADITDPINPIIIGNYTPYGETYSGDGDILTKLLISDLTVSNQFVYVLSNYGDGLYVIDASNPHHPFETAHYDIQGTDVEVIGEYVLVKVDTDRWQVLQMQPRWGSL